MWWMNMVGGLEKRPLTVQSRWFKMSFSFIPFRRSFVRSFVLWLSDFCFVFFHGFRIVCSVFGLTQIFLDFEGEKNRIEKSRRIEILSAAFWHRAHSSAFQIVRAKGISFGEKTQPYRIISWHDMRWLEISKGHASEARIYECFSLANI